MRRSQKGIVFLPISLVVVFFIVVLSFPAKIESMPNPAAVYCEGQGGLYENGVCVLKDGSKCNSWEFYKGECGQEYRKEIPCKKEGEKVIAGIGECCFGLESKIEHTIVMGASPSCQKPDNYFVYFINWIKRKITKINTS